MAKARTAGGGYPGPRTPVKPKSPATLTPAVSPEHDLADEATLARVGFEGIDLTGQSATSLDIEQCRFTRATLAAVVLDRATFTDCEVTHSDWANLRATRSSMTRVHAQLCRFTGLQWVDGILRDVTFHECRIDLAALGSTSFRDVELVDCNLTRADFSGADLRGAHFVGCDLSGARFADADAAGARFTRCQLAGVTGVTSLRGAIFSGGDTEALAHVLADALGIILDNS